MNESEGPGGQAVLPQALDILGELMTLGISPALRDKVQTALSELSQQQGFDAQDGTSGAQPASPPSLPTRGHPTDAAEVQSMEQKLSMSRSIMRKLYYKNVSLEKEISVLKANQGGVNLLLSTQVPSLAPVTPTASQLLGGHVNPVTQTLQDKDATIHQLCQALDAARRRCALLEAQLEDSSSSRAERGGSSRGSSGTARGGTGGGRGNGQASSTGLVSNDNLKTVLAQSSLHHSRYRQIRDDYNRLLNSRSSALQFRAKASAETKQLLSELQLRLAAEVQEREAEAALYSARLYESERAMSDWFVEKRLLQDHIARLTAEVQERDRLDGEIQTCVAGMFERHRRAEAEADVMRRRLEALGEDVQVLLAAADTAAADAATEQAPGDGSEHELLPAGRVGVGCWGNHDERSGRGLGAGNGAQGTTGATARAPPDVLVIR